MSKNNTNKRTFAEEGLEEIQDTAVEAEAIVAAASAITTGGEGEWEDLGALEPVAFYYRTSTPKKVTADSKPFKVLANGQSFTGEYTHKYVGGRYNSPTYYIRLTEGEDTGKLVGISGYYKGGDPTKPSGSLAKQLEKVQPGSVEVRIQYMGMQIMKNGEYEGTDAATFVVRSRPLIKKQA